MSVLNGRKLPRALRTVTSAAEKWSFWSEDSFICMRVGDGECLHSFCLKITPKVLPVSAANCNRRRTVPGSQFCQASTRPQFSV